MLSKIEEFLKGKKVYVLMIVGAIAAISQFAAGINLNIPELPPAGSFGELFGQLWTFATVSGFRAAIGKLV